VWPGEPIVDLADDKEIDEMVFLADDVFLTAPAAPALSPAGKGGAGAAAPDGLSAEDSKPVDLAAFKEKLQKKLGLSQLRDSKEFVLQKPGSRK